VNPGQLSAIAAYVLWGLFPFYWQLLRHVAPFELICHRIVWSFVALTLGVILLRGQTNLQIAMFRENPKKLGWSVLAAFLIATNWFVFVWSIQMNAVIESSLGYFITPLMSVALGVCVLGERLRPSQWLAVGLAALGVAYIALRLGYIPYLALTLASSFAIYGIVKKQAPLAAVPGLWLETGILLIPAMLYLISEAMAGRGSFGAINQQTDLWIMSSGPVTTLPLLLFAYGAQRIPLSQLGLLQYIAPSIQFIVGWLALGESVSKDRWIGFSLVWLGLFIFTLSSRRRTLAPKLTSEASPRL
jgi:chloramphenicol-sensitive protein RarD